ncbi:haloacid dehalogenase superfamily, subfamily IA, variant 1 with third motif having Dx(3-4)D or Dx(3-4)E [Maridesulfovibrio ferrireducens]|uniref:phosphoglycolate phosphatase n=1 Tax=Maridesulfovibrio ferrireducens TaxID=246191 RepID=A0A1G9HJJ4_9BACT|nr:HAD family hydrolase [Maridesulfovibrio ferrireducens]SDL13055.1 haloacid dehalogenase superfamily, subfamily IA, variant 1 with third motif having Dx(3-4)D or Dx(3-4)E [Maridesulfovibrio ferrireducens]
MEGIHLSDITPPEALKEIKGIIFDCDGVLISSFDANRWYYNWFKNKFNLPPMDKEEEKFAHAHTVFESLAHVLPEKNYEEALELRKLPELSEALSYIQIEEGLREVLVWLRDNNIRMAINTNRTDSLPTVLENLDIEGFFSPTVTSTLLPNSKPHPEGVHYILDKWSMKPEDVVYIGDTWIDESCASRAGVEFWAYCSPLLSASLYISDYWVLRSLFEKAKNNVWRKSE